MCVLVCPFNVTVRSFIYRRQLLNFSVYLFELFVLVWSLIFPSSSIQGVSGALAVLMKDAIKPTLMQTLEVRIICMFVWIKVAWKEVFFSKFVFFIFVVSSLPVFTAVSPHSLQFSWVLVGVWLSPLTTCQTPPLRWWISKFSSLKVSVLMNHRWRKHRGYRILDHN